MRPEKLYLTDIVDASKSIEKFLIGQDFSEFEQNEMMHSAVLQKLTVIGEAAARLSKEFTDRYPDVPWIDIVGFRNIAVHEYFAVRWDIVWVAATEEVPVLRGQVERILQEEFQD
jgi:uncharacterized protein with HEPN domain